MRNWGAFCVFLLGFSFLTFGESSLDINSSVRFPGETFERADARHAKLRLRDPSPATARDAAVPVAQAKFTSLPHYADHTFIAQIFDRVRDERFTHSNDKPDFQRRSSWLYPHDGCFARTALTGKRIQKWGYERPAKLFVFGDLKVQTPNAQEGYVSWWYHVVPVVLDSNQDVIVMDPAIDPSNPLPIEKWLARMGNSATFKVSVCDPLTFGPYDLCSNPDPKAEDQADQYQMNYLDYEWKNLVNLGRNPERELGEYPPWLNSLNLSFE
jgi:hypothetical protein